MREGEGEKMSAIVGHLMELADADLHPVVWVIWRDRVAHFAERNGGELERVPAFMPAKIKHETFWDGASGHVRGVRGRAPVEKYTVRSAAQPAARPSLPLLLPLLINGGGW